MDPPRAASSGAPRRATQPRCRADFHAAAGVLLVTREPPPAAPPSPGQPPQVAADASEGREILLAVWSDGSVTALHGHVDLGTGIATALAQLVAEELDVAVADVHVVLGSTALAPNQGPTIASATLQVHAAPLRAAAAQARHWLRAHADDLAAGAHVELTLDLGTPLKPSSEHRIVGQPVPRVDIPAKVFGEASFVHDLRLPGLLHGRVVRPPYAGADHGEFIGNTLDVVDQTSIAHIAGIRAVVVIRDFVGIVAEREEAAEQAMRELRVTWKPWPRLPGVGDIAGALSRNAAMRRELVNEGDVDAAIAQSTRAVAREYRWPYQLHASIGPSCAVAQWLGDDNADGVKLRVWAGTQNPHALRADLALLAGLPAPAVEVVRLEAAGCYGRNGADDVAADAVLLAHAARAPVRVQLTREQENLWEPKGAAQWMRVNGALGTDGAIAAWDFETSYPSNAAPTLALLLTRTIEPAAQAFEMGDRSARPPYAVPNLRVAVNDMAPILRASWLRGVSALPNSFAHESYVDELAQAANADPVDFRLRHLDADPRAAELIRATADRAGWIAHAAPRSRGATGDWLHGQGFAYARYTHSKWPGFGAAWSAWVADVDVNRATGEVHVKRVVVGHDAGLVVNPAGIEHQIHGNVVQTTSRALKERVTTSTTTGAVTSAEWGGYPILGFRELPVIEVVSLPRPHEPMLGAGESSSVPGTAAIANAIFDATGVRFRQPPFTADVVQAALNPLPPPPAPPEPQTRAELPSGARWPRRRGLTAKVGALVAGLVGLAAALLGLRGAIAPVPRAEGSVYSAATIEQGRLLAAAGNCAHCHTTAGGVAFAGGRAIETPFGIVHSSNLTPDEATGLGRWSFAAFARAMREGVSRDGRHLYPAFPYTAFAKMSEGDLTALYAYLTTLPAVAAITPEAELGWAARPLMGLWNALFHDPAPYRVDASQSAEWNRGAYLVTGVGHCGACHTPRNALGAERGGTNTLAGAWVEGWWAPALTARATVAVPWSADELTRYLRQGHTLHHGTAGGPMAPVVRDLGQASDADIRAMAVYLASFNPPPAADEAAQAASWVARAARADNTLWGTTGQRLFEGACSSCHHDGDGPTLLGVNRPLALSSKLQADAPDNLLRTVLDGVREPAHRDIGFMQGFRDAFDDAQLVELTRYLRLRFAPGRPEWPGLAEAISKIRSAAAPSR